MNKIVQVLSIVFFRRTQGNNFSLRSAGKDAVKCDLIFLFPNRIYVTYQPFNQYLMNNTHSHLDRFPGAIFLANPSRESRVTNWK